MHATIRKKNCLLRYTNRIYIAKAKQESKDQTAFQKAIERIVEDFSTPILARREVFLLTSLRSRFQELAIEYEIEHPESYTSQKLKNHLIKVWPEVSFVSQPGMSDLVYSKDISVGDALCKAKRLTHVLKDISNTLDFQEASVDTSVDETTDENIVHRAIGILRRRLKNTNKA